MLFNQRIYEKIVEVRENEKRYILQRILREIV